MVEAVKKNPVKGNKTETEIISNYPPGTKCWIPCKSMVWRPADVVTVKENQLVLKVVANPVGCANDHEDTVGDEVTIGPEVPIFLRNEEFMTTSGLLTLDDLTLLNHLHEAEVLHSLNVRFDVDKIYTFTGQILIALNPFKKIPGMYELETLKDFLKNGTVKYTEGSRVPHVFSTANQAYSGLCGLKTSQTILISGESGAGKTESTKFVMKLLAMAGSKDWDNRSLIENQVLQSNPLLEAFGNAKTLRNDNSSRFGKFIEMQFQLEGQKGTENLIGRLAGARIQTYLLESVRVCRQLEGERNYHAFYQLCAAGSRAVSQNGSFNISTEEAADMGVTLNSSITYDLSKFKGCDCFRYLTKSTCTVLKNVDDLDEFKATALAMHTVGIPVEEQRIIWDMVGAVLYLGNIVFDSPSGQSESSQVAKISDPTLKIISDLLGVTPSNLSAVLCSRTIKTRDEAIRKPLTVAMSEDTRDALSRAIYNTLFLRIVQRTNVSIGYRSDVELFCGVLDIFGFECFQINSFEQLCINFTNERLQQFFNEFVFKCEEVLYAQEGIPWDPLDFPDNQDCVELLQAKTVGLFAMLDEECFVPQGSDKGYCSKAKDQHKSHARFADMKTKPMWFTVNHFAGPVNYCTEGFMDKNKDQLSLDSQEAVKASKIPFVAGCFLEFLIRGVDNAAGGKAAPTRNKKQITVSSEFREQLGSLMNAVSITAPHFIRCIKPNPQNLPDKFDRGTVTEQLRNAGVLQAVQVSRAGYPVRSTHLACFNEYKCLLTLGELETCKKSADLKSKALSMLTTLDARFNIPKPKHSVTSWAVGSTKVFMKHEAYEALSAQRILKRAATVQRLQEFWKTKKLRTRFLQTKKCISTVQQWLRAQQAISESVRRQDLWLAETCQKWMHGYLNRSEWEKKRKGACLYQTIFRSLGPIRATRELKQDTAATVLQSIWRMTTCKRMKKRFILQTLRVQCWSRQRAAERQTTELRRAAKDNKNLQFEKEKLQKQLEAAEKQRLADLEEERARRAEEMEKMKEENKRRVEEQLENLRQAMSMSESPELETLKQSYIDLKKENERLIEENQLLKRSNGGNSLRTTTADDVDVDDIETRVPSRQITPERDSSNYNNKNMNNITPQAIDELRKQLGQSEMKLAEVKQSLHSRELGYGQLQASQNQAIKFLMPSTPSSSPMANKGELKPPVYEMLKTDGVKADILLLGQKSFWLHFLWSFMSLPEMAGCNEPEIEQIGELIQQQDDGDFSKVSILTLVCTIGENNSFDSQLAAMRNQLAGKVNVKKSSSKDNLPIITNSSNKTMEQKHITLSVGLWSLPKPLQNSEDDETEDKPLAVDLDLVELNHLRRASQYSMFCYYFCQTDPSDWPTFSNSSKKDDEGEEDENFKNQEKKIAVAESLFVSKLFSHIGSFCKTALVVPGSEYKPCLSCSRYIEMIRSENLTQKFSTVFFEKKIRTVELMEQIQSAPIFSNKTSTAAHSSSKLSSLIRNMLDSGSSTAPGSPAAAAQTPDRSGSRLPGLLLSSVGGAKSCRSVVDDLKSKFLVSSLVTKEPPPAVPAYSDLVFARDCAKPGAGAVTCVKFGAELIHREFFLLAVAFKAGSVYLYRVARTVSEIACFDSHVQSRYATGMMLENNNKENNSAMPFTITNQSNQPSSTIDKSIFEVDEKLATNQWLSSHPAGIDVCRVFDGHQRAITSLFFACRDSQLVSTSIDNTVKFWDIAHGHLLKVFTDSVPILLASFLPHSDDLFLTSNSSSVIRLVSSSNGRIIQKFKANTEIREVCFDESGFQCVAGTRDGSLQIYDVCGEQLKFSKKHSSGKGAAITSICFHNSTLAGTPFIAVNSCDHKISIYDCIYKMPAATISSLRLRQKLEITHQMLPLTSRVLVSNDRLFLLSASEDGKVHVFGMPSVHSNPSRQTELEFVPVFQLPMPCVGVAQPHPVICVDASRQSSIMVAADTFGTLHFIRRVSTST